MAGPPLLSVRDLTIEYVDRDGPAADRRRPLDGLCFEVQRGEAVGLVGPSGCGKTTAALALMRLLPAAAHVVGGQLRFDGVSTLELSEPQMRGLRGNKLAMVFQEPMTALNPVYPVGEQIAEALRLHRGMDRRAARERVVELLTLVRLPAASERVRAYPHQLSGGMRQRVLIAMALACEPLLLIADEPTTALDATVEAQVLALLAELRQRLGLALLLISHDLDVVARLCQRVVVLSEGKAVEQGPTEQVLASPRHPMTQALVAARRALPPPSAEGEAR